MAESNSSSVSSATSLLTPRPALFTQTSMCPSASIARSRSRSTCARRVTSVGTASACGPDRAAISFNSRSRRAASTTRSPRAPSWVASAAPIPSLAPVMTIFIALLKIVDCSEDSHTVAAVAARVAAGPPDAICHSDAGRPRSRCDSAHPQPPRGSSERIGSGQRHARPDRPRPSIGRRTPAESARMPPSRRRRDGVRRAPKPIRTGRDRAGVGRGGAGTLPRAGEGEVSEDLPDDRGILQGGDQAQRSAVLPLAGDLHVVVRSAPGPDPDVHGGDLEPDDRVLEGSHDGGLPALPGDAEADVGADELAALEGGVDGSRRPGVAPDRADPGAVRAMRHVHLGTHDLVGVEAGAVAGGDDDASGRLEIGPRARAGPGAGQGGYGERDEGSALHASLPLRRVAG